MDRKLQETHPVIDPADLFRPSLPEMDLNQPVDASPPRPHFAGIRSTTDPLQINFASADIVEKLHHSRTSTGMKTFALIFVGGPTMILGLGLVVTAWSRPEVDASRMLFMTVLGSAMAGFWPYVIFAGRGKK